MTEQTPLRSPVPPTIRNGAWSRINLLLATILGLCIARLWLMPLTSSFWVDEMGSVFVVHRGAGDPSLRAAPQVADSIYYVLPSVVERIFGLSEVSYRVASTVAMFVALMAIGRIGASLIHPHASWFVMFGCMASRGFDFQAADARPYALGTLVLSGGLLGLVHWLDSGRMRDGLFFAACAATLWWVHLVFWPFYVVFLIYGAYRVWSGESEVTWAQVASVFTVVLIACAPVAIRAVSLLHAAATHVVVPRPSFSDLLSELKLGMVTGACALAALLSRWFRWSPSPGPVARSSIVLIMAWWLVDPLALYVVSTTTSTSLFVPRYMYLALPGAALIACAMARLFIPGRLWKPVAACLGCAVLLFGGHWNRIWPAHQNSDWRTASQRLRDWSGNADVPVICPSPFIEARAPVWSPNYPVSGFLYSHLAVYPITGHVYPFPFESSPEAAAFARQLTAGTLTNTGRFAVFGGDRSVRFWRDWFAAQPEFSAWNNEVLGLYGDVEIIGFVRKLSRNP